MNHLRAAAAAAVLALLVSCGGPAGVPPIMSRASFSAETLTAFLLAENPALEEARGAAEHIAHLYIAEAEAEGVNCGIAFAQMCVHTKFLSFSGTLCTKSSHNFCGIIDAGNPRQPYRFPDDETGVRAHIQHLKAYASAEPLRNERVDPRYALAARGSAPTLASLAGKWAPDAGYSARVEKVWRELNGAQSWAGGKRAAGDGRPFRAFAPDEPQQGDTNAEN